MSTEELTSTPKPPAPKYGDPISEERQAELQGMLDVWAAEADHGERKGPFDKHPGEDFGVRLTSADVFWLAEWSGRGVSGAVPNLHLEGAFLAGAQVVGANLFVAHLERANLTWAHLEGANLGGAHLETLYVNPMRRAPLSRLDEVPLSNALNRVAGGLSDPHGSA